MKKYFYLILAIAGISATAQAAAVNDTIADIRQARRVVLTENDSLMTLMVTGNGADSTRHFVYTKPLKEGSTSLLSESAESWDFNLSFVPGKRKSLSKNSVHSGGIAFGFVSAIDAPQGMEVDFGSSHEIMVDIVGYDRISRNGIHVFSVSLGLDWRNYRMTGKQRFVKVDNDIVLADYPEGAQIDFSRIKVFSLSVPFTYTYRFSESFDINVSAALNFNTYASIKTRYKLDGEKQKEMTKHIHQNPVTLDFRLGVAWKGVGLYVKYSPFDVLDSTYGPSFKSLSTGFSFFF